MVYNTSLFTVYIFKNQFLLLRKEKKVIIIQELNKHFPHCLPFYIVKLLYFFLPYTAQIHMQTITPSYSHPSTQSQNS